MRSIGLVLCLPRDPWPVSFGEVVGESRCRGFMPRLRRLHVVVRVCPSLLEPTPLGRPAFQSPSNQSHSIRLRPNSLSTVSINVPSCCLAKCRLDAPSEHHETPPDRTASQTQSIAIHPLALHASATSPSRGSPRVPRPHLRLALRRWKAPGQQTRVLRAPTTRASLAVLVSLLRWSSSEAKLRFGLGREESRPLVRFSQIADCPRSCRDAAQLLLFESVSGYIPQKHRHLGLQKPSTVVDKNAEKAELYLSGPNRSPIVSTGTC